MEAAGRIGGSAEGCTAVTLQDGHEERPRVPEEVGGEVGDQASGHGHDTIAEGRLGKPGRAERVWSVFGACVERVWSVCGAG